MKVKRIFILLILSLCMSFAYSQDTCTYLGTKRSFTHKANWSCGYFPTSTEVVVIPEGFGDINVSTATFYNLIVYPTSNIVIRSFVTLTVDTLFLKANTQTVAQLQNDGILVANLTIFERYIDKDDWHFLASPIIVPYTDIPTNLYSYNESLDVSWTNKWQWLKSDLSPLYGYDMHLPSDTIIDFKGVLNNNDTYVRTLTYTDGVETAPHKGWSVVGNPYPSAINVDNAILTNCESAFYVWDGINEVYMMYVDGIGINGGSEFIMPTQGFWMKSLPGGGSVEIDKSCRVFNTSRILKSYIPITKIKISGYGENYEVAIRTKDSATIGFDKDFDARRMGNKMWIGENIQMSINSVPIETDSIDIFIETNGGNWELDLHGTGIIKDNKTGEIVEFPYGYSYQGMVNRFTYYTEDPREPIVEPIDTIEEPVVDEIDDTYFKNHILIKKSQVILELKMDFNVQISNINGQILYLNTTNYDIINLKNGIYIIKIWNNEESYSRKFIIR
jgi:hypothetical protein